MRYQEGSEPNQLYPHSEGMHAMLSLSMVLALIIGAVLLYLGLRGKVMWLSVWSVGLILASVSYLVADAIGLF